MIDFRPALHVSGILLAVLGGVMTIPMLVDYADGGGQWQAFGLAASISIFLGVCLAISNRMERFHFSVREAFLLTFFAWTGVALFAALPFYFAGLGGGFTDAFFEATSGITTTGSTILSSLDHQTKGILLWRALLQWLGGIGFIVVAIAILPTLKVGGMQLFLIESSNRSGKVLPRAAQIASGIFIIYLALSIICALLLALLSPMTGFEAIAHSMTTISTGGFSTSDGSIGHFNSGAVDIIVIIFMIAGSLPFVLYLQAVRGDISGFLGDSQVRWFFGVIIISVVILTLWRHGWSGGWPGGWSGESPKGSPEGLPEGLQEWQENGSQWLVLLRQTLFNTVSFMTGTGFVTTDVREWGSFAMVVLFFLMMAGGCAGSTTCGIKIFRFQVIYTEARVQIMRLINPRGVIIPYYNRRPISDDIAQSVMGFFFLFALSFSILALSLSLVGLDFRSALSGAATAIANVGPALGEALGPQDNFSQVPLAAKWLMSFGMIIGRLELYTVIVLFAPAFWRR